MLKKILLSLIISVCYFINNFYILSAEEVDSAPINILIEATSGTVISEKNSSEKVPVGTLNKIMSALIVAEDIDAGRLSVTDEIIVGRNANSAKGAVIWLREGEKISVLDLIKGMVIGNANDATITLAEHIAGSEEKFVYMMNEKAKALGLKNTTFKNCCGYDEEGQESTAWDIAMITRELIKYEWLYPIMTTWNDTVRNGETQVVNENKLVKSFKGIIGVKAGHSEQSGNSIALASQRENICFISVVLGADKEERFTVAKELINNGFSAYSVGRPHVPLKALKPIRVKGGVKSEVKVKSDKVENIVLKNGAFKNVKIKIEIPELLEAPVLENQELGNVIYTIDNEEIYRVKLLSSENSEKLNFFIALKLMLKNVLKM